MRRNPMEEIEEMDDQERKFKQQLHQSVERMERLRREIYYAAIRGEQDSIQALDTIIGITVVIERCSKLVGYY